MTNTKELLDKSLNWKTIYYHEELDADNSFISYECVQEARYRSGYLVKNTFADTDFERRISITFVPDSNHG